MKAWVRVPFCATPCAPCAQNGNPPSLQDVGEAMDDACGLPRCRPRQTSAACRGHARTVPRVTRKGRRGGCLFEPYPHAVQNCTPRVAWNPAGFGSSVASGEERPWPPPCLHSPPASALAAEANAQKRKAGRRKVPALCAATTTRHARDGATYSGSPNALANVADACHNQQDSIEESAPVGGSSSVTVADTPLARTLVDPAQRVQPPRDPSPRRPSGPCTFRKSRGRANIFSSFSKGAIDSPFAEEGMFFQEFHRNRPTIFRGQVNSLEKIVAPAAQNAQPQGNSPNLCANLRPATLRG